MFAEAEDANAIIFFDEADALFGKQGEVKEVRDRWGNIEINYLLQRVEEYAGMVIMASNLRQNVDEAFMRHIHVIVEFPFPEADARFRIWRGMFPQGIRCPPDDDIQRLAVRFRLSGGNIKNLVKKGSNLFLTYLTVSGDTEQRRQVLNYYFLVSLLESYFGAMATPSFDIFNDFLDEIFDGITAPDETRPHKV